MEKLKNRAKLVSSALFVAALLVGTMAFAVNQVTMIYKHHTLQNQYQSFELESAGLACIASKDPLAPKLFCMPSMREPASELPAGTWPRCGTETWGKSCVDDVDRFWPGDDA